MNMEHWLRRLICAALVLLLTLSITLITSAPAQASLDENETPEDIFTEPAESGAYQPDENETEHDVFTEEPVVPEVPEADGSLLPLIPGNPVTPIVPTRPVYPVLPGIPINPPRPEIPAIKDEADPPEMANTLQPDRNGDGHVDIVDVAMLYKQVRSSTALTGNDTQPRTEGESPDILDVARLYAYVKGTKPLW